jgi:shikimate kinase
MFMQRLQIYQAPRRMRRMGIVLVGYRGSGKTSVGRLLAERWGVAFVDLDERITAEASKTIREIFEQQGEVAFRDIESRLLAAVLAEDGERVVSLGGGAIERAENRRAIRESGRRVIYLRCEPEELLRRISGDPQTAAARPNLTKLGGGIEEIKSLLARREPWYREVAHGEIDVSSLTVDEVVAELMRQS